MTAREDNKYLLDTLSIIRFLLEPLAKWSVLHENKYSKEIKQIIDAVTAIAKKEAVK